MSSVFCAAAGLDLLSRFIFLLFQYFSLSIGAIKPIYCHVHFHSEAAS